MEPWPDASTSLQDVWESKCLSFSPLVVEGGSCVIKKENSLDTGRAFRCLVAQKDRYPLPVMFLSDYTAVPLSHDQNKQNDFWIASVYIFLGMHMHVC